MASSDRKINIGTRGSALALVQADMTKLLLSQAFPEISLHREIIKTTGDRRTDVSLADVAKAEGTFDKGVFIKEIEDALAENRIDIAVHSLKDLPTVMDDRFELAAVLERAPVRDVLLSLQPGGVEKLPHGARVGTSSVRRAMQIKFLRPDLLTSDIRGNVPTRIAKLAAHDEYDAILLAEAGLVRLDLLTEDRQQIREHLNVFTEFFDEETFFPAAGQGAIGLEIRKGDSETRALVEKICHAVTWKRITAEREFLRLLDGGCHTPVGVSCVLNGSEISMSAQVFPEEGGTPKNSRCSGSDPIETATQLFNLLK